MKPWQDQKFPVITLYRRGNWISTSTYWHTAPHYTTLHHTALNYTSLHFITFLFTTLQCTTLLCSKLHCTTLVCSILHYIPLHWCVIHYCAPLWNVHSTAVHSSTLHHFEMCTPLLYTRVQYTRPDCFLATAPLWTLHLCHISLIVRQMRLKGAGTDQISAHSNVYSVLCTLHSLYTVYCTCKQYTERLTLLTLHEGW